MSNHAYPRRASKAIFINPFIEFPPAAAAAISVEVGSFTKATATGNQDITITTDGTGFASGTWAVIFWGGTGTTSGTWAGHGLGSLGFVANGGGSISQYAVSSAAQDNVGTSNTARRYAAACISLTDVAPSNVDEATFTAFQTSTTMRINWSSQAAGWGATKINYMIISGLTAAKVVNFTSKTTTGNQAVTVSGVDLSSSGLVLLAGSSNTAVPQSSGNAYFGIGAMNSAGEQWANSLVSQDNVSPSNTSRWQRTDSCLLAVNTSEGTYERMSYVSLGSGTFTFNQDVASGAASECIALCMSGVASKIGSFATSGASQSVTHSLSATVKGGMFSMDGNTAGTSPTAHALWSLGGSDGTNQRAISLQDKDNVTPSVAKSVWTSTASILVGDAASSPTSYDVGSVTFTSSTVMDFTWTNADTAQVLYLVFG